MDGVLIEQHVMTLILRESVDPFHGGEPFSTYMYVVLERSDVPLQPGEADGNPSPTRRRPTPAWAPPAIRPSSSASSARTPPPSPRPRRRASPAPWPAAPTAPPWSPSIRPPRPSTACASGARTRWRAAPSTSAARRPWCSARSSTPAPAPIALLPRASVIYFALPRRENPASWSCNQDRPETCLDELARRIERGDSVRLRAQDLTWFPRGGPDLRTDLVYQCSAPGAVSCSDDRYDLTAGKVFGVADGAAVFFTPLATEIAEAFRYKTQFVDRVTGAQVGFAPTICRGDGRFTPYCYDPAAIEAVRDRMDCVMALYDGWLDGDVALDVAASTALRQALTASFSQLDPTSDDAAILSLGFERLYAELRDHAGR
ncbi:MAG: hypothetical protein R3F43_10675 [bacterium]